MPTKRPLPLVEPFEYAHEGHIHTKADLQRKMVAVEVHKCTAYLSQQETMLVTLQILGAGWQVWGLAFIHAIRNYMEQYYDHN